MKVWGGLTSLRELNACQMQWSEMGVVVEAEKRENPARDFINGDIDEHPFLSWKF